MRVLSLFDGISCGRLALERVGIPVDEYVAYEIDEKAIQISKNYWYDVKQMGDVTKADFTQYREFDLLIGGSPCQSLSITQAKTRTNLDGKSKLFFEFARAMQEVKPKYFLFENVASMNEESKRVISGILGCEPVFIDSRLFSAQQRPRYYWTNIPIGELPTESPLVLKDILLPESEIDAKYYYDAPLIDIDMSKQVCATIDIRNNEMHRRVFNPEFKMHTLTCVSGGHQQKKVLVNGRCRKLTPVEYERLQTLPDNYTAGVADGARYTAIGNGWTVDVVAFILEGLK